MRVYCLPQVAKLMRKENLPEASLCRAAFEVASGTLGAGGADLGSGLFKKRVARPGGGKRGGYRVVVACSFSRADKVLYLFAFAKNTAATLTLQGHEALAKVSAAFFTAADMQVADLLESGDIKEMNCDGSK